MLDSYLRHIICVFLCMHVSLQDFSEMEMEREKCFLSVKLNDNLVNSLHHRKALLTMILPPRHFVNETIKSLMCSSILLACTHVKGSYECHTVTLQLCFFFVYPNYF